MVVVLAALPAEAVDSTGQGRVTGWAFTDTAAGASASALLPGNAAAFGPMKLTTGAASAVKVVASSSDIPVLRETAASRSAAASCIKGKTAGKAQDCGTRATTTVTFPHPVVNPVLRMVVGVGTNANLNGTTQLSCSWSWLNARISAVNGQAPAAGSVALVRNDGTGYSWNAGTLTASAPTALPTGSGCVGPDTSWIWVGFSGVVSSIQIESSLWSMVASGDSATASPSETSGTWIAPYIPVADLQMTKSAPAVVDAGGSVTWSLAVHNNGGSDSHGFIVRDAVPASVGDVSLVSSPAGCSLKGQDLLCTVVPTGCSGAQSAIVDTWLDLVCTPASKGDAVMLIAGGSLSIALTGTAPMPRGTVVTNTARVSGVDADTNTANNVSATSTTVQAPTLSVGKKVVERANAVDQFVVAASTAQGSAVSVTTTGSASSATSAAAQIVRGQKYTISEAMAPGSASTIARYAGQLVCRDDSGASAALQGSGPSWNFTATENRPYTCVVENTPRSFTVEKSASTQTAHPGDTVRYRVHVTNTGQAPYTNETPASFSDDLSRILDDADYNGDLTKGAAVTRGTVSWSGPLAVGESVTIEYSATVRFPLTGDGRLLNTVVTPDGTGGSCPAAKPAPACSTETTVELRTATIQVEKTAQVATGAHQRLAGAAFAILTDVDGLPGAALSAAMGEASAEIATGLFAYDVAAPGTYWLAETRAPAGYSLLVDAVKFTVAADGVITLADPQAAPQVTVTADGSTLTVVDLPAFELPHAGGSGTSPLYLAGGALLLVAAVAAAAAGRTRSSRTVHHHKENA